jgi:hypothetical protein
MKKVLLSVLIMVGCSALAFAWGSAGHAYIDSQLLDGCAPLIQANAVYGGMAPDLFDYVFSVPCKGDISHATHSEFAVVWNSLRPKPGRALLYGFVSHNDLWGADFSAHHSCLTCGAGEGYVIAKARYLMELAPLPPELPVSPEQALELYHNFVETAVDVLITRIDPAIGRKITSAALLRSPLFPDALADAYKLEFASCFGGVESAAAAMKAVEKEFRQSLTLYGQALCQDEATAVQLLAGQTADLAEGFLGVPLPMPKEEATALVVQLVQGAMQLCESDFAAELEATIADVGKRMSEEGYVLVLNGRD